MNKTKIILLISSLIFLSLITFLRSKFLYTTLVDDSYIFFRYADNFVHVNNFIWNIGDKPIEGYTSFLYLLILIAAKFSSLDLELFSVIFGLITSTLTLFFAFKIYNHLNVDLKKENLFTTFLIAISPIFLYWSSAGMETPFYSMFLLLTIYCYLKLPDQSNLIKGLLFGLLCTIRFEATVFFLYSAFMMIRDENSFYKIRFTKSFIYFVLGFAFIFLPYFIWRWNYFGYFLPNTFYSKTGGGLLQVLNGFHYTIISLKSFYGLGWIFLFCILLFSRLSDLTIKIKYLLGIFILSVLSTIFVGGDHFYPGRFIVPVLPLFFSILPPALNRFFSLKLFSKVNNFIKFSFLTIIVLIFMLEKLPYQQSAGGLKNLVGDKKPEVTLYYSAIDGYIPEWQYGWVLMGKTLKKNSQIR